MRKFGALTIGFLLALLPSMVRAQGTDRSEMDQWIKNTQSQTEPPAGTTITMSDWQQYKSVMPLGMIKLFQGTYGWKMPADVSIPVGPHIWEVTYPRPGWKPLRNTAPKQQSKSCLTGTIKSRTTMGGRRSLTLRTLTKDGKPWPTFSGPSSLRCM